MLICLNDDEPAVAKPFPDRYIRRPGCRTLQSWPWSPAGLTFSPAPVQDTQLTIFGCRAKHPWCNKVTRKKVGF